MPRHRDINNRRNPKKMKLLAGADRRSSIRVDAGVSHHISAAFEIKIGKRPEPDCITSTLVIERAVDQNLLSTEGSVHSLPAVISADEFGEDVAFFAGILAESASAICDWRFASFYQDLFPRGGFGSRFNRAKLCLADVHHLVSRVDWQEVNSRLNHELERYMRWRRYELEWLPTATKGPTVLKAIKVVSKVTKIPERQLQLAIDAMASMGKPDDGDTTPLQAHGLAECSEWERLGRIVLSDLSDLKQRRGMYDGDIGQTMARDLRKAVQRCKAKYFTFLHKSLGHKTIWGLTEEAKTCAAAAAAAAVDDEKSSNGTTAGIRPISPRSFVSAPSTVADISSREDLEDISSFANLASLDDISSFTDLPSQPTATASSSAATTSNATAAATTPKSSPSPPTTPTPTRQNSTSINPHQGLPVPASSHSPQQKYRTSKFTEHLDEDIPLPPHLFPSSTTSPPPSRRRRHRLVAAIFARRVFSAEIHGRRESGSSRFGVGGTRGV